METRRRSNPRYVLVLVFGGVVVCTTHTLDEFDLWISTNWFRVSVSGVSVLVRWSMCVCAWCLMTGSLICSFFMTIPAVHLFIVVEHIVKSLVCVRCPLVFHTGSNIGEPIFMHSVFVFLEKPTFDYVICFYRRVNFKAVLLSLFLLFLWCCSCVLVWHNCFSLIFESCSFVWLISICTNCTAIFCVCQIPVVKNKNRLKAQKLSKSTRRVSRELAAVLGTGVIHIWTGVLLAHKPV